MPRYIIEPRKGFLIAGFGEISTHGPNPLTTEPLNIPSLENRRSQEPLLVLHNRPYIGVPLLKGLIRELGEFSNQTHRVRFTTCNDTVEGNNASDLYIDPDGTVRHEHQGFAGVYEQGWVPNDKEITHHITVTTDPKKRGETGRPLEELVKILDLTFPGLELDEFSLRMNLTGTRYDIRVTYERDEHQNIGEIGIYTPFNTSKRKKKRNKKQEESLFSILTRGFLSVQRVDITKPSKRRIKGRIEPPK